jgi:hypothetical protein
LLSHASNLYPRLPLSPVSISVHEAFLSTELRDLPSNEQNISQDPAKNSGVDHAHLTPHGIKVGGMRRLEGDKCPIRRWRDAVQVNLVDHIVQEIADLIGLD